MFTPVSIGNLVVDARIFREISGFRDYRHLSEWDLTLRLSRTNDPVTIERPIYRHRIRRGGAAAGEVPTLQSRLVAQEQATIMDDYWRGLVQDGFADSPLDPSRAAAPTLPPDSDARAAVATALWGLDHLRRVPLFYRTVRRLARLLKRMEGRFR